MWNEENETAQYDLTGKHLVEGDKQIIIVNILFQFLIYQKAEITVLNTHYLLVNCDELVTEYKQDYKQYQY